MKCSRRTVVVLGVLAAGALLAGGFFALRPQAGEPAGDPSDPDAAWGEAVDGLACRLVVRPHYVIGQAISATIEVKGLPLAARRVSCTPRAKRFLC